MKPRKLYNDWYHKYLKIMLKVQRENPQHKYSFDSTFKSRPSLKKFYNKRGLKPKCKYSALAKVLMKEVHVKLRSNTNVNQRQNTNINTVLRDFSCTVNINNIQCTIMCMAINQTNSSTLILIDCTDNDSDNFSQKIGYGQERKFFTRNTSKQKEVQELNNIDFSTMNYKSEEDMFMLSTVVQYPEVLIKIQRITEALDNKPTLNSLYSVLRELQ